MKRPDFDDRVECLDQIADEWHIARVVLLLSAQFVAETPSGRVFYGLYSSHKLTWREA